MSDGNIGGKSVYRVLAMYVDHAQKVGNYIKGSIDGKEKLENFLKEYSDSSKTKFIIRSSCKKSKEYSLKDGGNSVSCTRYGKADRIYWEFNNRNLVVPFTGTPFVTNSSQVKHCQHGAQYYKLKAEKTQVHSQGNDCLWNAEPAVGFGEKQTQQADTRRRRIKTTKKRNCPAYMYIREVVLFPEYALPSEVYNASKHILRKEKANLINQLKDAMHAGNIRTIHRYFLNIPLPEAHADHPVDANAHPIRVMDPLVRNKIDELLTIGYYELRHIQLIIHDFVREMLIRNGLPYDGSDAYPTEQEINDYIYLSTITGPAVVEVQTREDVTTNRMINARLSIQEDIKKSIQELTTLIHSCTDEDILNKAEKQMKKMINKVKNSNPPTSSQSQLRKRPLSFDENPSKKVCVQNTSSSLPSTSGCLFEESLGDGLHCKEIPDCTNLTESMLLANNHDLNAPTLPSEVQNEQSILTSFNRLMESDHDILPSLVDHVVCSNSSFHQGGMTGPPGITHLNNFNGV